MAKVMLEMVALVLQCVEGLVLNPPPRAASTYQVLGITLRNVQIRHPTEALLLLAIRPVLRVLQVVDDHVRIGLVQLQAMHKQDLTQPVPLLPLDRLLLIPVQHVDEPVEQECVVAVYPLCNSCNFSRFNRWSNSPPGERQQAVRDERTANRSEEHTS